MDSWTGKISSAVVFGWISIYRMIFISLKCCCHVEILDYLCRTCPWQLTVPTKVRGIQYLEFGLQKSLKQTIYSSWTVEVERCRGSRSNSRSVEVALSVKLWKIPWNLVDTLRGNVNTGDVNPHLSSPPSSLCRTPPHSVTSTLLQTNSQHFFSAASSP